MAVIVVKFQQITLLVKLKAKVEEAVRLRQITEPRKLQTGLITQVAVLTQAATVRAPSFANRVNADAFIFLIRCY